MSGQKRKLVTPADNSRSSADDCDNMTESTDIRTEIDFNANESDRPLKVAKTAKSADQQKIRAKKQGIYSVPEMI